MGAPGKQVGGLGRDGPVTTLAQQSHIAGQRRRITGDIDHPLRRHPGDGVDDGRMQPLARRVHRDDIRPDSVLSQFLSGLAGVGAEEIRVLDAVAPGVFPGVGDGLLDDLHPDDPFGGARHGQRDGAGAAVEVQHRLPARQARLGDGGLGVG